jgi:cellulose synthase/poly-beta-1,6-N-acetylglucosamine synthase-like glycosyltransferase
MDEISIILITAVALPYVFIILMFNSGWKNRRKSPAVEFTPHVSVVVAFRNEEPNLTTLLSHLTAQNYPSHLYEVILVDDHSTDGGANIVERFRQRYPNIRLISCDEETTGKKQALYKGIKASSGQVIITTDADCTMNQEWMRLIAREFSDSKTHMVIAPVLIEPARQNLFARFQELELFSLSGTAGGSLYSTGAILCNGANLAFRKKAWEYSYPHIQGEEYASGDDMFLLQLFRKKFPHGLVFLGHYDAVVFTHPVRNLAELFRQRIRWASKSPGFSDKTMIITGLVVMWMNILLALTLTGALFIPGLILPALLLFASKMVADFPLLHNVSRFAGRENVMFLFPLLSLIYPYYVTLVMVLSLIVPVTWKDRKLRVELAKSA